MSRHVEVKPGKNLTIAGPANVHIKGGPALSGTQPVPGMTESQHDNAGDEANGPKTEEHANHKRNARHGK